MNPRARHLRFEGLRSIGCMPCRQNLETGQFRAVFYQRIEVHHLNSGGHAGQKRRGDDCTVGLCGWHHRAVPLGSLTRTAMARIYGPSLASGSKPFRAIYGDDDSMLEKANAVLSTFDRITWSAA